MDPSKKKPPVTKSQREPSTTWDGMPPGSHQVLERCFPRESTRRTYHSSPFDFVQYRVRDESPPLPSAAATSSSHATGASERSGEKRKRGVGRGRRRMGVSPNASPCTTESGDNGEPVKHSSGSFSAASSSSSSAADGATGATTSTGNEPGARWKVKDQSILLKESTQRTYKGTQVPSLSDEELSDLEGDPEVNAKIHGRYMSPDPTRGNMGSGRIRPRNFGMGILTRGGARRLVSVSPSRELRSGEENEWTGGYGSDGIRNWWPPEGIPRGAIRGLHHTPDEDYLSNPTQDDQAGSLVFSSYSAATVEPSTEATDNTKNEGNKEEKEEAEVQDVDEDKDEEVDTILKSYFEKYQI